MKSAVILVVGLCFGALAGWLVLQDRSAVTARQATASYLMIDPKLSIETIAVGETIRPNQLVEVALPTSDLALANAAFLATAENRKFVTLRPVNTELPKGRVLTSDVFADLNVERLDQVIPEGMRAVALPVNAQSSLNNQVAPGNRIDVLGVTERGGELVPEILLEDVRVISVGDIFSYKEWAAQKRRSYSTITLEVTAEQAKSLVLARQTLASEITIAMRNQCDSIVKVAGCL